MFGKGVASEGINEIRMEAPQSISYRRKFLSAHFYPLNARLVFHFALYNAALAFIDYVFH